MPWRDETAREHVTRTEHLLAGLDALPGAGTLPQVMEAVGALVALYGEALARVLEHAARTGGDDTAAVLASDELVGHLLLVHGLHPDPVEVRVERALEEHVRPALRAQGGAVELLSVDGPVARVRLRTGGCGGGCPSTAAATERAVRDAVTHAAPEVERIETERPEPAPAGPALIPVDSLFAVRAGTPR